MPPVNEKRKPDYRNIFMCKWLQEYIEHFDREELTELKFLRFINKAVQEKLDHLSQKEC